MKNDLFVDKKNNIFPDKKNDVLTGQEKAPFLKEEDLKVVTGGTTDQEKQDKKERKEKEVPEIVPVF